MMRSLIELSWILGFLVTRVGGDCTFPSYMIGTWSTNSMGTIVISATHFDRYPILRTNGNILFANQQVSSMKCLEVQGTKYVLQGEEFAPFSELLTVQTCLDIRNDSSTTNKFLFYQATADDGTSYFRFQTAFDDVCTGTDYEQPYSFNVALKSGSELDGAVQCSSQIFGTYNYNTCNDSASTNTTMNVCDEELTRQYVVFNYTMCDTPQVFSLEGSFICVHLEASGTKDYLMVYNRDSTTPDDTDYFRYTCLAIEQSGSTVQMSAYPEQCLSSQTGTAVDTGGYLMELTPYFLCPITTETSESTEFPWIIIVAVILVILLLVVIALIIYCCCLRKRRKQEDEESIKSDSESETGSQRAQSRADIQQEQLDVDDGGDDEEKQSLDSGISEPATTDRSKDETQQDDILVMHDEGDGEDDKASRPRTGQDDRQDSENDDEQEPEPVEEQEPEVEPEPEEEPEEEEEEPEPKEESEPEEDPESEKEPEPEVEPVPEPLPEEESDKEENASETNSQHQDEDGQQVKTGEEEDNEKQEKGSGSETDEETRQYRTIGLKNNKYDPTGTLTTRLVTRDEDERKRNKLKMRSKKQQMKNLAKKKSDKTGGVDGRGRMRVRGLGGGGDADLAGRDEDFDSDDEMGLRGGKDAPFLKQYHEKKRLEHILDEQHYWSDPEADKEFFGDQENFSSVFGDRSEVGGSDSDVSTIVMGPDGVPIKTKRSKKTKGDGEGASETDSEAGDRKRLKRTGSLDSMMSTDDPDNPEYRKSKRKQHEHQMKQTGSEAQGDGGTDGKGFKGEGEGGNENGTEKNVTKDGKDVTDVKNVKDGKNGKDSKDGKDGKGNVTQSKTKLIQVKPTENGDVKRKGAKGTGGYEGGIMNDFSDTDMDNLSDRDSGLDDDEEAVDVVLKPDQQQIIVDMLFDADMNLRPEFARDEYGRIIRRLDGSVIYDPHTGRFTFRRKLAQLFKVPRLKRNDKGRPTGGYIEDEFGPKHDTKLKSASVRSQTQSARNTSASASPGSDTKRARGEGKNVGFHVPDDDVESLTSDQLAVNKRGRRDIASAIRRQLNRRLFRKLRRKGPSGSDSNLPEVQVRKAWTGGMGDPLFGGPGDPVFAFGSGRGRPGYQGGTPGSIRRGQQGPQDQEKLQMYRDGLESDRKILEGLQDRMGKPIGSQERENGDGVQAFDEDGENHGPHDDHQHFHHDGPIYYTDCGRIGIRERNCPELKGQVDPLFRRVRRPYDIEKEEHERYIRLARERPTKSAPLLVQDVPGEGSTMDRRANTNISQMGLSRSQTTGSQLSIDDNRLRRLLEELYRDKKYLDRYIDTTEPKSDAIIHSKGLAEHGRGYLLQRADYWEQRGPLPKRPPMTEIGWKMQQQLIWSEQNTERSSTNPTVTPDIPNVPNAIDTPRDQREDSPGTISPTTDQRAKTNESMA